MEKKTTSSKQRKRSRASRKSESDLFRPTYFSNVAEEFFGWKGNTPFATYTILLFLQERTTCYCLTTFMCFSIMFCLLTSFHCMSVEKIDWKSIL